PEPVEIGASPLYPGPETTEPFTRLRRLNLEGCRIGDVRLLEVVGVPGAYDLLPALTDLDLSGNDITYEGVLNLVASPLLPRLRHLVLGGNPIGDDAAEGIANAAGTSRLEHLNVRFTNIGPRGQKALLPHFGGKLDLF